jgi:hypothetical protein
MRFCLLLLLAASTAAQSFTVIPKAARTVNLVYEVSEADVYYCEMVVEKTTDGSFFTACGWDNGFFGLQQYDGEDKRALIFAVWNGEDDLNPEAGKKADPVKIIQASDRGKTNQFGPDRKGAQFMRQIPWKVGEVNRFVVDATVAGSNTTYTAWFYNHADGNWEKLATFRAFSAGKWMRGYNSFIEDMRRDTRSAAEVHRAQFGNVWIHEYRGTYVLASTAMFAASASKQEAWDTIDAGQTDGLFTLTTGGGTIKTHKIGERITLSFAPPLREPEMPRLPFLNLNKPAP